MSGTGTVGGCSSASRSVDVPQLGAHVHFDCSPEDFSEELAARYGSFFCTTEYFSLYVHPHNSNICILDAPRHTVLFCVEGHTAAILNRLVDIEPAAMRRIAGAIFTAAPSVWRIRAEVKYPPERLGGCTRTTNTTEDMVVDLPADVDAYHGQIGNTTRKHLRQYNNKLRRELPEFEVRRLEKTEITLDLVRDTVAWTAVRVHAKGDVSVYEDDPAKVELLWRLLQSHGLALCGHVDDELAAAQLLLHVGDDLWIHTTGFDSRYERQHLGLLMTYFSVLEGIALGCRRAHMLFGTPVYKKRLGAEAVTAYDVSLFRTPAHRALYTREVCDRLWRDRQRIYWAARGRARDALVRVRPSGDERTRPDAGDAQGGSETKGR